MSGFDWNDFKQTGDWITFDEVGDQVIGVVTAVRSGKDFNGNPCPELVIDLEDDGGEKTLTAGQVMLKKALAEAAPQVGDRIWIMYSGVGDAKPGRAPAKLFEVKVKSPDASSLREMQAKAKAAATFNEAPF
jgi:hypothetical protein